MTPGLSPAELDAIATRVAELLRPQEQLEEKLIPKQVADQVQVCVKTVMRAIAAGDLEASQLTAGGTWRIKQSAVEAWLELRSNRQRPERPLAPVEPVGTAASAARRARRQTSAGRLRVTDEMGRQKAA